MRTVPTANGLGVALVMRNPGCVDPPQPRPFWLWATKTFQPSFGPADSASWFTSSASLPNHAIATRPASPRRRGGTRGVATIGGVPKDRTSAGILLFRRAPGGIEVLLGHPGGPIFTRRDEGVWSIPKGLVEAGEDLLSVGEREFLEETGHPAPAGERLDLGSIVQKGGKTVHAWAVEGDLDPSSAQSNLFQMEWPPRSGRVGTFPEIDRVAWFSPAEAARKVNPAQVELIDRLRAQLDA